MLFGDEEFPFWILLLDTDMRIYEHSIILYIKISNHLLSYMGLFACGSNMVMLFGYIEEIGYVWKDWCDGGDQLQERLIGT